MSITPVRPARSSRAAQQDRLGIERQRLGRQRQPVMLGDVIGAEQQFAVADVDDGRQGAGAMQQEVAVRQVPACSRRNCEYRGGVELHDQTSARRARTTRHTAARAPRVVAGQPHEEITRRKQLSHRCRRARPVVVVSQFLEGELAQAQPIGVGGGPCRHRLTAVGRPALRASSSPSSAAPAPAPAVPNRSTGRRRPSYLVPFFTRHGSLVLRCDTSEPIHRAWAIQWVRTRTTTRDKQP